MSKNEKIINNKYLKIILIIICGALGVLLILGGNGESSAKESEKDAESYDFPSIEEYEKSIEEKIVRLCSGVRGVGKVSAVVTLDGGYNAVYAQDSQSSSGGYRSEFVLVGGGSSEKALLIGYTQPCVAGVGIICVGGGEEYIRCELISLVSSALGISPSKIYVAEAQK